MSAWIFTFLMTTATGTVVHSIEVSDFETCAEYGKVFDGLSKEAKASWFTWGCLPKKFKEIGQK